MNIKTINPIAWLFGWTFYLGTLLFFIYWVFAWGLSNGKIFASYLYIANNWTITIFCLYYFSCPCCIVGGTTLQAWGTIFWISLIQDLTAIEFINIYFYYIVGVNSIRKQIFDIHKVLKTVLFRVLKEGSKYDNTYVRICQHMSGACRAAHTEELYDLPSARLLRELDDDDIAIVRQTRHKKVSVYWGFFLGVPALIASLTSDIVSDLVQKCIPPLLVGGFLLLNAVLVDMSIYAVITPYVSLFVIYVYIYFIYHPARNRINMSLTTGIPYANNRRYFIDRVIVFLSYDGIKKYICANNDSNVISSMDLMCKIPINALDNNDNGYESEHNQIKSSLTNNQDLSPTNQDSQAHTNQVIRQTNIALNDSRTSSQEKRQYSNFAGMSSQYFSA